MARYEYTKRFIDFEKGDKVRVINRKPYEQGYGLQDYGEIYQVMHDTVVVLFDNSVAINMDRNDIMLV